MFSQKYRLTKKRDIDRVFRQGNRAAAGFVFCNTLENGLGYNRYTVMIGLKSGLKAAGRNLFKRRTRAIIIDEADSIHKGLDMIVGFRGRFEKVPKSKEIAENIDKCLKQLRSGASGPTKKPYHRTTGR